MPAGAQPGTVTLTAKVTAPGGPGGRPSLVEATTTVAVAAASLSAAYNNTGISDNADESAADYDGSGDSFSAQALAAGTPTALTPGTKVTIGGTTFTWPDVAAGTPDNVVASGQTIALSGSGTDLGFLGSSQNGTATGTVTVHYTDGSTTSTTLNMADWYANAPAVGNQLLDHHVELELPEQFARRAPGEPVLRLGAAGQGEDRGVGHAAHPEHRGRHHRDAHLRHGHRVGNADGGRPVLVRGRGLRQRGHQRQLRPGRGGLRRHRGELLGPGAGGGHPERTEPGPGHAWAGPPSPGPPRAVPTT